MMSREVQGGRGTEHVLAPGAEIVLELVRMAIIEHKPV